MTTHIALLRAINVGGNASLKMAELRDLVAGLGFSDVRTLLQTGNLVFSGDVANGAALEALIETSLEKQLRLSTTVVVRAAKAWTGMVRDNPFADEAKEDPSHLLAMPLKATPPDGAEAVLQAAVVGRERVRVVGDNAYLVYPDGIGRSKLTAMLTERKLGTKGTARNWNTVMKLATLAGD